MASATAEVLVDTRMSAVHDLRQGSSEFEKMTNRAVLIGNVMASPPVLRYISAHSGVPPSRIRVQPPLTPDFPRPLSGFGEDPKTADLLRSTDQYRLNIQANPTVPILQVYAQAPNAKAAATLANAVRRRAPGLPRRDREGAVDADRGRGARDAPSAAPKASSSTPASASSSRWRSSSSCSGSLPPPRS